MIVDGLLLTAAGEVDSQVARLLIYEVPPSQVLTRLQNHGQACVWCGERGRLEPLGGTLGWEPAGCSRCGPLRLRYVRAYLMWARHAVQCTACVGAHCTAGEPFAFQHRVAYEGTGRRRPVICACGCAVGLESPLLRPCTAGIVTLRYSHAGACRAPERGRA
ncbi:hypothetical protein [Streptomyces griseoviridis]|uniref:hypothetical protein n=1 Tax=Streptomyces griseoviridis TaxID=45398 RepID=UPI0034321B08